MPADPIRKTSLNWPHLALLAALPTWVTVSAPWPPTMRLAVWLLISYIVLGSAERLKPYRSEWQPDRRALRRDGSVFALNLFADAGVSVALAAALAAATEATATWPLAGQVLLGIGLGELVSYTLHRASHRDGWLWRVHLLHHRPERVNVANALTAHPINAMYDKLGRMLPMLVLGLSDEAIVIVTLFTLTQNLAVHANVAGTLGVLNLVIGSAELHRLHHSTQERQAGNFGTTVPWWDLLFGTFRWREAPERVGVFEPARYPDEYALLRLLAWPFSRRAVPAERKNK